MDELPFVRNQFTKRVLTKILLAIVVLFPAIAISYTIFTGSIPFWFDPARDLLLGLENIKKFTLIGHPSGGIPGVHYGPYYIWFISLVQLFTRDPRLVSFVNYGLPYFIGFPLLLYAFRKVFGLGTVVLLWLLFIFTFNKYASFIWNPHLAPLLYLALVYMLIFRINRTSKELFPYIPLLLAGFISGLILNIHISFGSGIFLGSVLFLIVPDIITAVFQKNMHVLLNSVTSRLGYVFLFIFGVFVSYIPFLIFETRHSFLQIHAIINAFSNSMFYNSAVTGATGFTQAGKIQQFFVVLSTLLHIRLNLVSSFCMLAVIWLVLQYLYKRKGVPSFTGMDGRIIILLTCHLCSVLYLFLSSKNPVFDYHYIGVEVILLLILGFVLKYLPIVRKVAAIGIIILSIVTAKGLLLTDPYAVSSVMLKARIVETAYQDAGARPFALMAYDSAIYTYDYDYIVAWFSKDRHYPMPLTSSDSADLAYLIIPKTSKSIQEDFLNYKTPAQFFTTEKVIEGGDGIRIYKRVRINSHQ